MRNIFSVDENKRVNEINMISVLEEKNTRDPKGIISRKDKLDYHIRIFAYSYIYDKNYELKFILSKISKEKEKIKDDNELLSQIESMEVLECGFGPKGFITLEGEKKPDQPITYVGFTKGSQGILILDLPIDKLEEGSYELSVIYDEKILSTCPFDIKE